MAIASVVALDEILRRYSVRQQRKEFVSCVSHPAPDEHYLSELQFTLHNVPCERSEAFTGEALIYPTLRQAWRHYAHKVSLFIDEPIQEGETSFGRMDYLICRRSPLGPFTPDLPLLIAGKAKGDNIERGWLRALAGMTAARQLASDRTGVLFGLSTTGSVWSFGKFEDAVFTQDPRTFTVAKLDHLFGALHFILRACVAQLATLPPPSPIP